MSESILEKANMGTVKHRLGLVRSKGWQTIMLEKTL